MIKIKKGLDLPVGGVAEQRIADARDIGTYAVRPTDYVGLVPRLLAAEGDRVSAGDALLCDKNDARVRFVSPVSGVVKAVVRGEKRKLLAVVVERNGDEAAAACWKGSLRESMLYQGLWPMLRQRPFGTVANPDDTPKAIVVSCFDSAPLAPDYDFALRGREQDLCKGLEALSSLGAGRLYVCFRPGQRLADAVEQYAPLHRDDVQT
ncbi:MAG: NADH:ubiquinone reductase (Na(+)-transporting) subunit A, partial [Bacteroidales bacterium]|nr:NADH:ubiquinone reductase (Na(+)-transporting) subunit A [Bacteroidales bacterium]